MRILQVNKFFYRRGGAEVVFFDTINGLRERGHEVSEFAMQNPQNFPSEYAAYFAPELPEFKGSLTATQRARIFLHLFKSAEIEKRLRVLVHSTEPQVAHVHNAYHHLSASTFLTLKKLKVPIVLTLHDVFPLCPNHSFLIGESLAEHKLKKIYKCTVHCCIDNKFFPSLAGTLEAYYYRLRGIWKDITLFICPSQFMMDKMVEYGFPKEKMRLVRNPFAPGVVGTGRDLSLHDLSLHPGLGTKILYLGRLHYEKGIKIFMRALVELRENPVVIAGTGPDEQWVDDFIARERLPNVERRGFVAGEAWQKTMAEACVVVVPSVFLENSSLSILEALGHGRLVVATDRGGNPEIIINGVTGFLAKPEDSHDLARAIRQAMEAPQYQAEAIIKQGRELVKKNHDPDNYFRELIELYSEVIQNK